jgi:hypothetical protein
LVVKQAAWNKCSGDMIMRSEEEIEIRFQKGKVRESVFDEEQKETKRISKTCHKTSRQGGVVLVNHRFNTTKVNGKGE